MISKILIKHMRVYNTDYIVQLDSVEKILQN